MMTVVTVATALLVTMVGDSGDSVSGVAVVTVVTGVVRGHLERRRMTLAQCSHDTRHARRLQHPYDSF
jgi:NhaP-type Na+/H+ or K+/H+ antiporter